MDPLHSSFLPSARPVCLCFVHTDIKAPRLPGRRAGGLLRHPASHLGDLGWWVETLLLNFFWCPYLLFFPFPSVSVLSPSGSYRVISNRKSYLAVDLRVSPSSQNSSQLLGCRPCLRPFIENSKAIADINSRADHLASAACDRRPSCSAPEVSLALSLSALSPSQPCPALSSSSPPHIRPTLARDPLHTPPIHFQKARLLEQPHRDRPGLPIR